ncbi:MAG: hypothetical protein HZA52_03885 [Planctomycetes bacterium]|nr:hypothetical protein [Planctomycetota bacterium]
MTATLRIWCVACARDQSPTDEFRARIRDLARAEHVGWRISSRPEFVASFGLEDQVWRSDATPSLDGGSVPQESGDVLWLAEPEQIARRLAAALDVPECAAVNLTPRVGTLTALDHTDAADATKRPSLAGFELDWLPPNGGGVGAFPGATPKR